MKNEPGKMRYARHIGVAIADGWKPEQNCDISWAYLGDETKAMYARLEKTEMVRSRAKVNRLIKDAVKKSGVVNGVLS